MKPHSMDYCRFTSIKDIDKKDLHIGVIGVTSVPHKGKKVTESIMNDFGDRIPISIIGENENRFSIKKKKLLDFLGPYKQNELQKIIEEKKISLVIFPAIWPETFSFLVSELIVMNVPIFAFNLGAQKDKLEKYEKGMLFDNYEQMKEAINKLI